MFLDLYLLYFQATTKALTTLKSSKTNLKVDCSPNADLEKTAKLHKRSLKFC